MEGTHLVDSTQVYNDSKYLISSLTEIKPHTAITNQPEESKEKYSERKEYKESNRDWQNFEE